MSRLRRQQSFGVALSIKEPISVEDIAEHIDDIAKFDGKATYPTKSGESTGRMMVREDRPWLFFYSLPKKKKKKKT